MPPMLPSGSPPAHVLDLFAVPDTVAALPGGRGSSVRAGDLVLSPGRDAAVQEWLSPLLARLAVQLDEAPARRPQDLRIAMPVPARDGSWVVDGWAASRYEPGTTTCRDLDVTLAAGRVLHARLDAVVRERPDGLDLRVDRWARAESVAFGSREVVAGALPESLRHLAGLLDDDCGLGPEQLVHADLAGNVLLDAAGAPVVIDVAPAWRAVRWAEAVCVLDAVLWLDGSPDALTPFRSGLERQALLRALVFRVLSDRPDDPAAYEPVLAMLSTSG